MNYMFKVRITILKKLKTGDLLERYGKGVESECPLFKIGDEFIVENLNMPNSFYSWADIQRNVLALGGDFPWIKDEGTMISCCTDGFRPVIFKLERVEGK